MPAVAFRARLTSCATRRSCMDLQVALNELTHRSLNLSLKTRKNSVSSIDQRPSLPNPPAANEYPEKKQIRFAFAKISVRQKTIFDFVQRATWTDNCHR